MKNDEGAVRKAKDLSDASVSILVATPTIFELYVGVGLSVKSSEEREKVLSILRALPHLALDAASASKAGMIHTQRVKEKTMFDPEDAMLAGIAIQNNIPLLSRNRKHFAGIPD